MVVWGAHDAATGHGFTGIRGAFVGPFARTQSLTIDKLWDVGVRAFDLRPVVDKDNTLPIYHGSERTNLDFHEALALLAKSLSDNPSEFAILLLRKEKPGGDWVNLIGKALSESGIDFVQISDSLILGDVRGKALLLTRNEVNHPQSTLLRNWRHDTIANVQANNCIIKVQDIFNCTEKGRTDFKVKCALRLNDEDGWIINYLSGYERPRSARSSKAMTKKLLSDMRKQSKLKGILMLDFVAEDMYLYKIKN